MRRTTSTVSAPSDQAGLRAVGRVNFACVSFARGHTATARVLCVTDWPLARAPVCAALIPPQETTTPRRATAWNPAWVSGFPLTHACKHGGARMHAPVCVLSLSWLPLSRPGALSSCCVCDGSRDLCANVLVCAQATSPACPITLPATSATPKHGAAPQTWRVARVKCYSSIVPIESGVSLQLQAVSIEFDVAACSPRLGSDSRRS